MEVMLWARSGVEFSKALASAGRGHSCAWGCGDSKYLNHGMLCSEKYRGEVKAGHRDRRLKFLFMILPLPFHRTKRGLADRQELGECGQEPDLGKMASDTFHFLTASAHQLGAFPAPGLA